MVLAACSANKNTAYSRKYQSFITRYNVYFNGDEHFRETLKDMESKYEDEYSQRVYMHPAEAIANPKAPQPQGSFDRSIEKAQKAIQLHSIKKKPKKKSGRNQDAAYKAWMKREEYNPFLHNAWLMMGRSQYYKGDFSGAASTFGYIAKHFSWLPATVTEAQLWEARSYCAMDWNFEAETILRRIKPDKDLTSNTLKGLYYFTYADYYVRTHDYEKAAPMLEQALKYVNGSQKVRLNFLLGQVYADMGRKDEAYQAFGRAGGASSASYRTKFNARIKQSEVFQGDNIEPEVKALRRMVRYDRNKEYLDQIYYAIGNLYMSRRDTASAVEAYKEGIAKSTRSGFDKALVQLALGQIYFDQHRYDLAQPCYSEAVPLLPDNFTNIALLKRRSDVLDELSVYAGNVHLQDSLLTLADMTPEQQMEVVNRLIAELKKREKEAEEEARRAEAEANAAAQGNQLNNNNNAPSTFTMNNDDSWYFYNTMTRNQGKTEFQRRWGSRKLEDNWRRRNKNSFDVSDFGTDADDESAEAQADGSDSGAKTDSAAVDKASDPHNPEYYLRNIPKTDAERATAHEIIQEGRFNTGLILKDKLEDFPAARSEWDILLKNYPDNIYRLDVYYNLYLMYARLGDPVQTQYWRQMILDNFPDSKEGIAVADPAFIDNLKKMDAEQEALYADALDDYFNNRNSAVHSAYEYMQKTYPMSKIMPKFMFIEALAYVTEKNPEQFNATLKRMLELYPNTDMTDLASAYLRGMAQGRQLQSQSGGNMRGMIWDTRLSNDSTSTAAGADQPLQLELNPDTDQLVVLLYSLDQVQPNMLLFDVARHNFSTYVVRDFDLEQMQFGPLGLLVVKSFRNKADAERYRSILAADTTLTTLSDVRPVVIGVKDFDTMLRQGRSFEEYFMLTGEKSLRDTHESVLPADEYPPAEEMYPPSDEAAPSAAAPESTDTPETPEPAKPAASEKATEQPQTAPAPQPQQQQQPKPTPEPASQPKPKPQPAPTPAPAPQAPAIPEYPDGSEGDDPLLD